MSIRSLFTLLLIGIPFFASVVAVGSETQSVGKHRLEGSWEIEITPAPGSGLPPTFKALATFSQGGGVVETILLPPVVPAHGEWVKIGNREYVFAVVHHLFDPNGNFIGTVRANSIVNLESPSEFTATFSGTLFGPNGSPIAPISGTETAKRIKADTF